MAGTEAGGPVRLEGRTGEEAEVPLTELIAIAQRQVPDGRPSLLRDVPDPAQPVTVEFTRGRPGRAGIVVAVQLDPVDGQILHVRDPRQLAPAVRMARVDNFNIHVAGFGGPGVRLLYLVVCFAGAVLAAGGVLIWWLKRKKIETVEVRRSMAQV